MSTKPGNETRPETPLLVAGIGSYLSCDDETGLTLVKALRQQSLMPQIETTLWEDADALTLADKLLNLNNQVLLVDCAEMQLPPGSWQLLSTADISLNSPVRALSTHGLGLIEALKIAQQLGCRQEIHFFGIQPFDLSPHQGLSTEMQTLLPNLLNALVLAVDSLLQKNPTMTLSTEQVKSTSRCPDSENGVEL